MSSVDNGPLVEVQVNFEDVSTSNPLPVTTVASVLPAGAATAAKQDEQTVILQEIEEELDTIDADLLAFKAANHTDLLAVEAKQDAQTAILAEIEEDTDSIEIKLDSVITQVTAINSNTDGLEALVTSSNTKLDTLHADLVTVESKQDAQTAQLTAINANTDGLESLVTSSNTKLDTLHTDLVAVEAKQDLQTTQLTAINANTDGLEALVTSSNTKLDTVHADLVVIEGKQDAQTAVLNAGLDVRVHDGAGVSITSTSTSNGANKALHTQTPDAFIAADTLNALNDEIVLKVEGCTSIGFQINAGTLAATLSVDCSVDGGLTYPPANGVFFDTVNSSAAATLTFTNPNALKSYTIIPIGGTSHVKVRVSSYTSGSATAILRASQVSGASGTITAAAFGTVAHSSPALSANVAAVIVAANPNRKYLRIVNTASFVLTIQEGSSTGLTLTAGNRIAANGFYEYKGENLYTGAVYGLCSTGTNPRVTEGTP